jgi:hypothetical protein
MPQTGITIHAAHAPEIKMDDIDKNRREFLIRALSSGLFTTGLSVLATPTWSMGQIPRELPPGKSIYRISGKVIIDNRAATIDTFIKPNSVIETGAEGKLIFVVGKDAFILRNNSRLEMHGGNAIITELRLLTGKLLSVFGKRTRTESLGMKTVVATIGVRGTGVYLESYPEKTYVCTCYGQAVLASITDPLSKETVITHHHDSPRYILADAPAGKKIRLAPIINHTDEELELIETLVGRTVPFAFSDDDY